MNSNRKALNLLFWIICRIKKKTGEHSAHDLISEFNGFSVSIRVQKVVIEQKTQNRMSKLTP